MELISYKIIYIPCHIFLNKLISDSLSILRGRSQYLQRVQLITSTSLNVYNSEHIHSTILQPVRNIAPTTILTIESPQNNLPQCAIGITCLLYF